MGGLRSWTIGLEPPLEAAMADEMSAPSHGRDSLLLAPIESGLGLSEVTNVWLRRAFSASIA